MLYKPLLFLFLLALRGGGADVKVSDSATEDGCYMDPSSDLKNCVDGLGQELTLSKNDILPVNTSCILETNNQAYIFTCRDGVNTISLPEDRSLIRLKRQAYTTTLAGIGAVFGPLGAVIGGAVGFVADFVCIFVCGNDKQSPPPNHPPKITTRAVLLTSTPIIAQEGKNVAKVQWQPPVIEDPDDKKRLNVETNPSTFKNGGEFSEGTTVVFFKGTDSGGLTVTDYLSFEVKVMRCEFSRWPENGFIDCSGSSDKMFGTTCNIKCKSGYGLDEGVPTTLKCMKNGAWSPTTIPNCKPIACARPPNIPHGRVQCLNDQIVYGSMCEAVCDDGFQVRGMRIMGCDYKGQWGTSPSCKDVTPPRFLECPGNMQVYIDSANNTAEVLWIPPEGDDNSGENVTITVMHDYRPGQRLKAGSHTIKYMVKDKEGNRGDSCIFTIEVLTISCSPPNLNGPGSEHLKYNCPDSYRLGAVCNLDCKSGYPMGGATEIQCFRDPHAHPPTLSWKWSDDALRPFCKETNCSRAALNEPINGALACSEWTHGQMCNMQCNNGFDIPNIGDGMYVCGRSTGQWKPPGKVPDCNTKIDVNNMHLPSEFFYYTGKCNSSVENINQIKENFVNALNSSKFQEECVGVSECQAKYVDVTCGPVTSRRKRDLMHHLSRRSASKFAYIVHFELILPYKAENGKSADEIFAENEDLLYKMSDVIQKETDSGHFDLHIGDLQVESDSFGPGAPEMQCPPGTTPKRETASCVGCPKGQYLAAGRCNECPLGTYQNSTDMMDCEPCPDNTNTTETGAENITQCLEYCAAGEFSPNGLAPCTKCPSNSYQPNAKSITCIKCGNSERTLTDGATTKTQCKKFDLQFGKLSGKIEIKGTHDVITVFMWLYISNVKIPTAFEMTKHTNSGLSLKLTPTLSFSQKIQGNEVHTAAAISPVRWTNIALSIDKPSMELTLYINGKVAYKNTTLVISDSHVLEQGNFIGFVGDMKVSTFYILPRKASESEIASWASTCTPSITGSLASMDDMSEVGNVTAIIPSTCDAVDDCVSSPCGIHKCMNKLNGYECLCTGGFTGQHCEISPDFCKNNNCQNGATCMNGGANYTCQCPYGFSGTLCGSKAVDGQWSEWTDWSACSLTCNGGVARRTRRCDSPPPDPEGINCTGNNTQSMTCKEEKCPECSRLRRTLGLIISCNDTSDLQRCTISCRAGLYFTNPPLAYYECGVATGYKWNHQNEENPTGRLPSCSEIQPPVEIGVEFDGHYDSVPCTESGKKIVKDSLETKMSALDCKKTGTCETNVNEPKCEISKRKRATGGSVTVTVGIHATVDSKADSLNVASLLQNKTAPSKELLQLINQTLELETSAQMLVNNSVDFFQITIDGTKHSLAPGTSTLTSRPSTRCPSGTVPVQVFCAECPVGSYSDGKTVTMCPRGQYQDTKGQATCKKCPFGKTTVGIGSIYVSECSVSGTNSQAKNDIRSGSVDNGVIIGIGVSVSISLLILAAVAATLLFNYCRKRKRRENGSVLDLHSSGYVTIPTKPAFEKHSF